ncbi:MAG: tannase/feruloyl esterase family alpha/beta hydrolase [Sphingomicrobium sp.]
MSGPGRQAGFAIVAGVAFMLGSSSAAGERPTGRCAGLRVDHDAHLKIVSAIRVAASRFTAAPGESFEVPASCRITGIIRSTSDSEIGFELWLPDSWNGRFSQLGNGGFAGNIDHPSLANEIRRGNAAAMTDTGHKGNQFDASWAMGHPQKIIDYGYRSIKETSDAAQMLIGEYYGRPPRRRYFIGCSNGGRQALMAVQRYPADWDGIIAGSPAVQWTRQLATFAAIQHRLRIDPRNWIAAEKLPAIQRAATSACGRAAFHGSQCRLDTRMLLCRGKEVSDCLGPRAAATLELIQSGQADARLKGPGLGFAATAAAVPGNWDQWILNPDRRAPSELAFATQAFRYLVLGRADWEVEDLDVRRDLALVSGRTIAGRRLADILDADDPDLGRFERHGGKLIMYVGWADAVISPEGGVAYYRELARRMGLARTKSFARLFVAPGMQHCQGGALPSSFGQAWVAPPLRADANHDIRRALETWVEQGLAPASLTAVKYQGDRRAGAPVATQRLRPYPQAADEPRSAVIGGAAKDRPR